MKYQRSGSVIVLWILAACWGALCLVGGISALVGNGGPNPATTVIAAVIFGAAPLGAVWLHERGEARRAALRYRTQRTVHHAPPPPPAPQLPMRLQRPWNRLFQAWNVVGELQRQGWIDPGSTRGLPESMARLHRLAVADGLTDHLGGRRSSTVEQQISRLGDLLVALADEAVEHQATVGTDFAPATLAAAAQRLAADSAAYRELMELGGVWAVE